MSKRGFQLFSYRLPFCEPVEIRGVTLTHREGFLLRLLDADGQEGWGEVAPLAGFSRETPVEAARNTETVARLWCSCFPDPLLTMRAPSVRFGLEQAAMHIEMTRAGLGLHQLVLRGAREQVRVNALLLGDSHDKMARAIRSHLGGYRTVKIKVGRRAVEADAQFIAAICEDLGADVRIRLDANRAWSLEEAVRFGQMLKNQPIEYIEEPVSNPLALSAFYEQCRIPIALDETLADQKPAQWQRIKGVAAVILKPTLLGCFKMCLEIARIAATMGAMPVVSSSFESGVGTLGLAALAAAIQKPDDAAGLDPYLLLADDVLGERLVFANGSLNLAGMNGFRIRTEILKEISRG